MIHRIETSTRGEYTDAHGQAIHHEIQQLGIDTVAAVQSIRVTLLEGELTDEQVERIAAELLSDPISESFFIGQSEPPAGLAQVSVFEVHLKPGVMDPVAASTRMAIEDMGLSVESVRTARKYIVLGTLNQKQQDDIARRILGNDCIEQVLIGNTAEPPGPHLAPYQFELRHIRLAELDNAGLEELSVKMDLFLTLPEMKTIQAHFQSLQRDPTDVELETLAQTWSEHCVHKTFKSIIDYQECDAAGKVVHSETIHNLLKSTVAQATFDLDLPWCISVFEDNAGIITFDDQDGVCFKVETHNHPSAIEPYGGAATGIGGVIRDIMGTGLAARPLANTDVFCFAPPATPDKELPAGVLRPRRVMRGVVSGVRDYGNRMGIPTVNGAIYFDQRYVGNPLVFCGTAGLIPRDKCFGDAGPGELIVVVGGRTGRDGIHGATFSSGEMTHEHESLFSHAVQIGNAITEKKVLDTLLQARDQGLYSAVTDCGAGGLSSAVGEMGARIGASVELEKVPLKYDGLSYTEIWISEAQERMVIAVPPKKREAIEALFEAEDVEATVIGVFGTPDKDLVLTYERQEVARLNMDFLHDGLPKETRQARWQPPQLTQVNLEPQADYTDDLKQILAHVNVASKEWVIRQYDHEVQGGSVIKPLVGAEHDGPSDAAVLRPKLDSDRGIALGCGLCPQYSDIDPYWMALAAIDEALRNVVCVGADPQRVAILDNFCWGNCAKPDRLGALVRAAKGCYDAAIAYRTPFISGKDSLNNEFQTDTGQTIAIPGTLLISAMGIVPDVNRCVSMDLKEPGNALVLVGLTREQMGASHFLRVRNELGVELPQVDLSTAPQILYAVSCAINNGLVRSCHDLSEGGLAVALAEMAFAGNCGIEVDLIMVPNEAGASADHVLLFSESPTRFLLEVPEDRLSKLAVILREIRFGQIGRVTDSGQMIVTHDGRTVIQSSLTELKEAWQSPLRW